MPDENKLEIPRDANTILRERLKGMFFDLIPEDKLDEMLQNEWDGFFSPQAKRPTSFGYSPYSHQQDVKINADEAKISPFVLMTRKIIRELVEERLREILKEEIANVVPGWDNAPPNDPELLSKIVEKSAGQIWTHAVYAMVSSAATVLQTNIDQAFSNLQNQPRY